MKFEYDTLDCIRKINKGTSYFDTFLNKNSLSAGILILKPDEEDTNKLIQQRDLAQKALESVVEDGVSIRVWPHHFDTGAFFTKNEKGVGLGMAIPDSMIQDFYLYVSGYKGHDAVVPQSTTIEKGTYYSEGWKGFALPVSGISDIDAKTFFTDAINQYLDS